MSRGEARPVLGLSWAHAGYPGISLILGYLRTARVLFCLVLCMVCRVVLNTSQYHSLIVFGWRARVRLIVWGSDPGQYSTLILNTTRTVRDVAIEIDLREAVSRFLNVCAKSGGQSVDFYFPHAAQNHEIRRTTCRLTSFFWRTRFFGLR